MFPVTLGIARTISTLYIGLASQQTVMLFSVFKVGKCECSEYIPSIYALFICESAWRVLANYQNFTYHFELHLHVPNSRLDNGWSSF